MDKRLLALIYLAHASDVLENAFAPLLDEQYDLATKRVRQLLDLDPEVECLKASTNEVLWAVVAAFTRQNDKNDRKKKKKNRKYLKAFLKIHGKDGSENPEAPVPRVTGSKAKGDWH
ncbi:Golgi phosphoprotein 3 [Tupaia chinensis]|uniref:Golgi phosphoprotein 3 n=1 Tax=Tupaia chinensis TaxID=246437 RepID=L9KTJ3_TUPCH|nr:Golgi phosphoprotein 3 [Tupaia chinensis]